MKILRDLLRLGSLLLLLLIITPALTAQSDQPTKPAKSLSADKLRVLFIGNSYIYFNNLPQMLAELSKSARQSKLIEPEMFTVGGATLKSLWENGKALETLKSGKWDYVVLQEQSTLGLAPMVDGVAQISDPKTFHEYARRFNTEIKKAGAKTVFYLTWAKQNAPQTQAALTNAYLSIAKELKAIVAPAGIAWENALKSDPQLALHVADKSHPTPMGSYLAACVLYATIYGKSPEGLPGQLTGIQIDHTGRILTAQDENKGQGELINLTLEQAAMLQKIAWQTVRQLKK
ncbi:MAG: SGNH/GDSL hydrolase family protein [Acidobacteriota bacterium]|nr:SGNH/GDSL hydrolase family protein [Acidobacteriota bacterium]